MLIALVLCMLCLAGPAYAHSPAAANPAARPAAPAPAAPTTVGVDEHLGATIPLDLVFRDQDGRPIALRDLVDRPTVLSLVYFHCPDLCSPFLRDLVDTFDRIDLAPGTDFKAITLSFDPTETPDLAARQRTTDLELFHRPFPAADWTFLTGDSVAIAALTDAVGFRYQRTGEDYSHPSLLVILSPGGRIARYLYGATYLPFDLKLALIEAAEGRTGPSINRLLYYCFSYSPQGRTYVFNILKVAGIVTLFFLALFAIFLGLAGRRRPRGKS
jgi:protein SCO1/2